MSLLTLGGCRAGEAADTQGEGAQAASSSAAAPSATSSATSSPTSSPTQEEPKGPQVTEPGTQLEFGQTATVTYRAAKQRAVLGLTVESAKRGTRADFAGFKLDDPYQRRASYYYVRVKARNLGTKRFGGVDVPLWGISGENTLLPPVRFTSAFAPCPTEPLPDTLRPRDAHRTCLVFLSPDRGSLEGVSFRPTETYVPIEWHGKVAGPPERKTEGDRGNKAGRRDRSKDSPRSAEGSG